jgi:hypothetical protein
MAGWLLGLLWLAVLKLWLGAHVALDADALGIADLWATLRAGGHLGDWAMGFHPYVVPDLFIYGLGTLFARDVVGRQIAYGLILGFLLWWTLSRFMVRFGGQKGSTARAYSAAGLLLFLPLCSDANDLGSVFTPGVHGGALLCTLVLLAWVLSLGAGTRRAASVFWVAMGLGCVWASDQIVAIVGVLPALILSFGMDGPARRKIWGSAALAWIFRGLLLWYWSALGMAASHYAWGYAWAHLGVLWGAAWSQAGQDLGTFGVVLGLCGLVVGLLWVQGRARPAGRYLVAALGLGLAFSLALGVLMGAVQGRYFSSLAWLFLPLLPLLASFALDGQAMPLLACALVGVMEWTGPGPSVPVPDVAAQASWLDAQMAARGLRFGVADYWHARPLTLFSHQGLELAPCIDVGGGLKPYDWIVDRRVFGHRGNEGFVVLNGLDPVSVQKALGAPLAVLSGAGLTVWVVPPMAMVPPVSGRI